MQCHCLCLCISPLHLLLSLELCNFVRPASQWEACNVMLVSVRGHLSVLLPSSQRETLCLVFFFWKARLSYLYQVVQSSSCHHHEKRKRIMMQTVECRGSWWCRWPPSWWGWWGCRSFRWHRWPPSWCAASDLSGCGRPTIFSETYILSSLLYSFVSVTSSLLYCFVFCVLLALSPHPPVTMSPLQLVSKRPTHDSVVPLNIHWGMRASVEE